MQRLWRGCFIFKDLFIARVELEREAETHREKAFTCWFPVQKGAVARTGKGQRQESGARMSFWVCNVGEGAHTFAAFLDAVVGGWVRSGEARTRTGMPASWVTV